MPLDETVYANLTRRLLLKNASWLSAASLLIPALGHAAMPQEPLPLPESGRRFYLSASGNDANDGRTPWKAWRSLDRLHRSPFEPGDAILLRSGDHFAGSLHPTGSGSANQPILLGRYGNGPLPVIEMGGEEGSAIRLEDQCWWILRELEVVSGAQPAAGVGRQGIGLIARNSGKLHHITVHDCHIHDIWGELFGEGEFAEYNSAAIFVGSPFGRRHKPVESAYILIESNRIERINRCGIIAVDCTRQLEIRRNQIENLGGDAIVPIHCGNVMVERNVVWRSCLRTGDPAIWTPEVETRIEWNNPHSAAIWLASCQGGTMQFNEVYETGRAGINGDGEGYDIDLGCQNCLLQYNFSARNHGLLLMMQRTRNNIARYNISENDQSHILALRPDLSDGNLIHNNVFYLDSGTGTIEMRDDEREQPDLSKVGVQLRNNIFYATGEGRFEVVYADPTRPDPSPDSNRLFAHNCYFGPWKGVAPNDGDFARSRFDPLFLAPGLGNAGLENQAGYQLRPESPCIGAGLAIANNGGRDFWGNPLPAEKLDLGAFQHLA